MNEEDSTWSSCDVGKTVFNFKANHISFRFSEKYRQKKQHIGIKYQRIIFKLRIPLMSRVVKVGGNKIEIILPCRIIYFSTTFISRKKNISYFFFFEVDLLNRNLSTKNIQWILYTLLFQNINIFFQTESNLPELTKLILCSNSVIKYI